MNECPFESDVLDAIASQRWPARADADLRAHVAACESCGDLATVAGALLHDEETAYAGARVLPAAAVWHRAQLRAREEAVRAATRPIGFVQGLAFACGVAVAIGAAVWGLPIVLALLPELTLSWRMPAMSLPGLDIDAMALLSNTSVQIGVAASVLLASAALYFTLRDINS